MVNFSQWQQLWRKLGAAPDKNLPALYDEIIAHYNQAHRHYHTLQHLDECLEKFAKLLHLAEHPLEIELALWFHDAIYDPQMTNNEQLSADWAQAEVLNQGLDEAIAKRVYCLVMATEHHHQPNKPDEKILVDVDLAILATGPARFKQYEQQIRAEYAFVPEAVFKSKRAEVLERFLARATLFSTDIFLARYEAQARANITQALTLL